MNVGDTVWFHDLADADEAEREARNEANADAHREWHDERLNWTDEQWQAWDDEREAFEREVA